MFEGEVAFCKHARISARLRPTYMVDSSKNECDTGRS